MSGIVDEKELISIIIPVYNVERYLERCLKSVLDQTYKKLQIILVDDGSTDRSGILCDKYPGLDSRVEVIHKGNGGLSDARNVGLKYAKGSYIGFVDSDDYIRDDMYEKLYDALNRYGADIACCGRTDKFEWKSDECDSSRFILDEEKYFNSKEAIKELCIAECMDFASWDKLYKASLFQGVKFPKGRICEDIPVIYEAVKKANGIVHIGKDKYFYCHRKNSITGRKFSIRKLDRLIFTQQVCADILKNHPDLRKEIEILYFRAAVSIWRGVYLLEQYQNIEKKMRKRIIRFSFLYMVNPYTNKEELKTLLKEICFGRKSG